MNEDKPVPGSIGWFDLTVEDADGVRNFYEQVVGWRSEAVDMGGYSDYTMATPDGTPVGGVCHRRGSNAALPSQWLAYIVVADMQISIGMVEELGGEVIAGPLSTGQALYAIIRDPAGAVCALYQA